MKIYQSFEEIDRDLKQVSLERQIAFEELKMVKNDIEESLQPLSLVKSGLSVISKFGTLMFIKKIFK